MGKLFGAFAVLALLLAGALPASAQATQPAWSDFVKTPLVEDSADPVKMDIAADGRLFYVERLSGQVRMYDPATEAVTTIATLPIFNGLEDGLIGIALAPDFLTSGWVYLYYGAPGDAPCPESDTHATTCGHMNVSRFTMGDDGLLDMSSEIVLLQVGVQRDTCCHSAGGMAFDSKGNLYLSTGDNTNPFESSGYDPIDERDGRSSFDAQRSSANTNDLRGKVLRIHPEPDGSYTIPEGNLFAPGTAQTRPEIYAMGFRNPYTISIDPATDALTVADFGPDASFAHPLRGPEGRVEWNLITSAGNYGWPYCVSNNAPYHDFDFTLQVNNSIPMPGLLAFDCAAPVNNSPNNTGLTNLPPARPATMWIGNVSGGNSVIGTGGAPITGAIYHYDESLASPGKLPAWFDNSAIFAEWNTGRLFRLRLDGQGGIAEVNRILDDQVFLRPHATKIGPDGALYLIEWGSAFGGANEDSGIHRFTYEPGGGLGSTEADAAAVAGASSGPGVALVLSAAVAAALCWGRRRASSQI